MKPVAGILIFNFLFGLGTVPAKGQVQDPPPEQFQQQTNQQPQYSPGNPNQPGGMGDPGNGDSRNHDGSRQPPQSSNRMANQDYVLEQIKDCPYSGNKDSESQKLLGILKTKLNNDLKDFQLKMKDAHKCLGLPDLDTNRTQAMILVSELANMYSPRPISIRELMLSGEQIRCSGREDFNNVIGAYYETLNDAYAAGGTARVAKVKEQLKGNESSAINDDYDQCLSEVSMPSGGNPSDNANFQACLSRRMEKGGAGQVWTTYCSKEYDLSKKGQISR
jgi:hypothetical protein